MTQEDFNKLDKGKISYRNGQKGLLFNCGWWQPTEPFPLEIISPHTEEEAREIDRQFMRNIEELYKTTDDERFKESVESVWLPEVYAKRKAEGRLHINIFDASQCPNEFWGKTGNPAMNIQALQAEGFEIVSSEYEPVWGQGDGEWNHVILRKGSIEMESTIEGTFVVRPK